MGAVSLFYFLTKQSDRKTELFNHKNITGLTQKLARKPTTVSSSVHVAETGPASEFKHEGRSPKSWLNLKNCFRRDI